MYKGENIVLRSFEREDAVIYRQWVNHGEIMPLIDRVLPVTQPEHQLWYEKIIQDPQSVIFAIEALKDSIFIGCVWLYNINQRHRHAEIRIVLGEPEFQGKGLGSDALSTISHFAFHHLNLHKVYAYTLANNPRAQAAFEKVGFLPEGLLKQECFIEGKYVDMVRLAMIREEH